jgi:hypothetical protein
MVQTENAGKYLQQIGRRQNVMNESEAIARLEREREVFRNNIKNCRAALRMIREAVETHAPPGSVPAEEHGEPPFTAEAEALVKGIIAIVNAKDSG